MGPTQNPSGSDSNTGSFGGALKAILRAMDADRDGQAVCIRTLPARVPSYAAPNPALPPPLQQALRAMGVERLYSHQVETLEAVRHGDDVVVVTSTSSGKTLCYNIPVLERLLADPNARALYLYPINALINDQYNALEQLNAELGRAAVTADRYSGATSSAERRDIRTRQPRVLLTNPEMVHLSFLQWHRLWAPLWKNLAFVILDEVHTYRGVFGAHMAGLLRRLLRVAAHYGARPQFICSSATIANPQELVQRLTSRPCTLIGRDGSASGARTMVLWNPPLQEGAGTNVRRSYTDECADLLSLCLQQNLNTIVFTRARRVTELLLRQCRELCQDGTSAGGDASQIATYRAGYLAEERERIETRIKSGELHGVIATNALELGIDIGALDSVIIAGYPGSIMSIWQQAGRAGRGTRDALVFFVASQNALDQHYMQHPQRFFAESHEEAIVDLANPFIRLRHLLCSAQEIPWTASQISLQPEDVRQDIDALVKAGLLVATQGREPGWTWPAEDVRKNLHLKLSLRASSQGNYSIRDEQSREIGTIQPPNAYREAHVGAIYQHSDGDYRVTALNRQTHTITVRPETLPHYTRSQSETNVTIVKELAQRSLAGCPGLTVHLGELAITEVVRSYQELELGSNRPSNPIELREPLESRLLTTGVWLALPSRIRDQLSAMSEFARTQQLLGGLHALEHLLADLLPLMVMCDRQDIAGDYALSHRTVGAPAVFLYDTCEGGIGLAESAFERIEQLLAMARDTVSNCPCESGCPACIQSSHCRRTHEPMDKQAAQELLLYMSPASHDPARPDRRRAAERYNTQNLERAIHEIDLATRQRSVLEAAPPPEVAPVAQAPAYTVGSWVRHSVYGRGLVTAIESAAGSQWITVRFARRSVIRRFAANTSELRREA
ncbi:MAG: DEAD/DEAH box helicase [Anaerolineae bacterium]|jgi:DEAD/DEAH box helicase domain-containing protein|nr:DEAD/DEAH box helicase [Chloroflexota bacterium]